MTPRVQKYAAEAVRMFDTTEADIFAKCRKVGTALARRHMYHRLSQDAFTNGQIARWMNTDASTVWFSLHGGRARRKAKVYNDDRRSAQA